MRERVDVYVPRLLLLNPVIADRGCRVQCFVDITLLQASARLGRLRPHAGVTVSLQLQTDGELVGFRSIRFLRLPHALISADEMLHMMSELMRDYISLGEISRRSEALPELVKKSEIEVDALIDGTIKRTHSGLRGATPRIGRV